MSIKFPLPPGHCLVFDHVNKRVYVAAMMWGSVIERRLEWQTDKPT